jgi:excisionase family DNA binding protein
MKEIERGVLRMPEEEMYTAEEVAKIMKVHISTVRKWVRTKALKTVKIGVRGYRIRRSDLDRFIEERGQDT